MVDTLDQTIPEETVPVEAGAIEASSEKSTPVELPEPVLDKGAFLQHLRVSDETEVVEGARIRVLGRKQALEVKVLQSDHAMKHKGRASFELAEDAALLSLGVVEPALSFDEWLKLLGSDEGADNAKVELIIARIKDLAGMGSIEEGLTKKVLDVMMGTSET